MKKLPLKLLIITTIFITILLYPSVFIASPQASPPDQCFICHAGSMGRSGPHGETDINTVSCLLCHDFHSARNIYLTDAAVITATCLACHDFSASGRGVYLFGRVAGMPQPSSSHRVPGLQPDPYSTPEWPFLGTETVPGGDRLTGGPASLRDRLTCVSCHSPHGGPEEVVQPFYSDSNRLLQYDVVSEVYEPVATSKLLRRTIIGPGGLETTTNYYGSAWCAGCHLGQVPGTITEDNETYSLSGHPLDLGWEGRMEEGWAEGTVYDLYRSNRYFILAPAAPGVEGRREFGSLGGRFQEDYRYPGVLCQSCHHNERNAREEWDVRFITVNGYAYEISQSFPHQSLTPKLLVTKDSDAQCLHCHSLADLP